VTTEPDLHDRSVSPLWRQIALAFSVLQDRDVVITGEALLVAVDVDAFGPIDATLTDDGMMTVSWDEVGAAVGLLVDDPTLAQERLARWIRLRAALATTSDPFALIAPVGLPRTHPLHPGPGWAWRTVPGGVLDLGPGIALPNADDASIEVHIAHPLLLKAAGIGRADAHEAAENVLYRMAGLAIERLTRRQGAALTPVGTCDVVTLLASPRLRSALCHAESMISAAVPMRRRGWTDLRRVDPAFTAAAAACVSPAERGFERPILLTTDEVVLAAPGGSPIRESLSDPAPSDGSGSLPWGRVG